MKILTSKNGVALLAVLAVLMVLTLLLPVMFKTTENATYSAVTELSRQKAGYLARTGTEMAVATLKTTLKDEAYKEFYEALTNKEKTENTSFGITKVDGHLRVKLAPINLYQQLDGHNNVLATKYISGEPDEGDGLTPDFKFIGKADVTITFNGDPEYYKVDEETGTYEQVTKEEAYNKVSIYGSDEKGQNVEVEEIKEGYVAIYNDNYMVKSVATVDGQRSTRSAVVIETVNMLNEEDPNDSFVAYTGQTWQEAPEFIRKIEGDYPVAKRKVEEKNILGQVISTSWVDDPSKTYDYGRNHIMVNPFKATSKKTIKAFGQGLDGVALEGDYYNKDVYIFSAIGNMHINLPNGAKDVYVNDFEGNRGGSFTNKLVLGAYPGLNWRVFENPNTSMKPSLQAMNYKASVASVQRYNFTSFCATDTLQVSLPVELRVNPKRTNRIGDGSDKNCTLFKVMNFQAKDIVFEERIDLFASLCIEEFATIGKRTPDVMAYRGGFVNLTAPVNTPYSYYNEDRKETVSAGIVYFSEPVYLWFQDTDALGADTSAPNSHNRGVGETMYRVPIINKSSKFSEMFPGIWEIEEPYDDIKVFKIFEAGDVYYFNAEAAQEESENGTDLGVNLVNWFLETQYVPAREDDQNIWDYIFDFKTSLYLTYLKNTLDNNRTYVNDDMHKIGNMLTNPTLIAPDTEDELYVVWDN